MRRSTAARATRWLSTLLLAAPAWAGAQHAVTGTVGATSDFVFRGLSYTDGDPAAQVSLDVELASGVYAGGFISTTDPNAGPSPKLELDIWAGRNWELKSGLSADLRFTHYAYPDDPRVADYDRDEITATLGVRNAVFVGVTYSSNTRAIASAPSFGRGDAWALELSARRGLGLRWTLAAGVGRYLLDDIYDQHYDYWSATLSGDFAPWQVHLAVLGSDSQARRLFTDRSAGDRVALTVLYRFTAFP